MAASAILNFINSQILLAEGSVRAKPHHYTKFHQNLSIHCSVIATVGQWSGPSGASSPLLDLEAVEGSLSSLPWCEQVEWEEQEVAASAAAPAAIPSELSTASQEAPQPPAEPADLQPSLRDLDVVHAVQTVCPGQVSHLVTTMPF